MKARSAKAKGSSFERDIAKLYRDYEVDKKASRMPLSGADSYLKGDIRLTHNEAINFRFVPECKHQGKPAVGVWWEQAKSQCSSLEEPLLYFKLNYKEPLAVLRAETLISIFGQLISVTDENRALKEGSDVRGEIIVDDSKSRKNIEYQLKYAKEAINKCLKELNKE